MAVSAKGPPLARGGPDAIGLGRKRPERSLLALRRGGWVSAAQVAEAQRVFLIEAVAEAVGQLGYARTTTQEVVSRSGVSRLTFYELFAGVDDCLLAALDRAHARVWEAAGVGRDSVRGGVWTVRVRGAVTEVLALLDAQPLLAGLCVLGAPTGPPAVLAAQRRFAGRLARGLALSAREDAPPVLVSPRLARALIAGASAMLAERLIDPEREQEPLLGLAAEVTRMLCGPFTAAAEAGELTAPPPGPVRDWTADGLGPTATADWQAQIAGSGVRTQILAFLAAAPGASNTQLVVHLGATPSAVSRRLARMAGDGLIHSTPQGSRHAWRLTDRGAATLGATAPAAAPLPGDRRRETEGP